MGHLEDRIWEGNGPESGLSRRDRQGCRYTPYIPDRLEAREFTFDSSTAADISDAERAIYDLDAQATALVDTEALARLLLRAESVASSKIEGLVVGARRLLRADAARASGEDEGDVTAAEVVGNIEAMSYALETVRGGSQITLPVLLETHRRLLQGTEIGEDHGGRIRMRQNWIGGSSYNPCSAVFVPPPPEMVEDLLVDLCAFCNEDSLPPVAQAAIAHAQFETIHPFADGNGRVGRALIHMIFRARGLTERVSPPVSLVLATHVQDYLEGLRGTAYDGAADSSSAIAAINRWVGVFAGACARAAADAMKFEKRIAAIQREWRARLGSVRADSAALKLIDVLPGAPVITLASANAMIERSLRTTMDAMRRLTDAGIVTPVHVGRQRKQIYEAREIIELFTALERQLASPAGDTQVEPPNRHVPARK